MKEYIETIRKLDTRLINMIGACEDENLKKELIALRHDLGYQAPECLWFWGADVSNAMERCFGAVPQKEWEKKLVEAWTI